MAVQRNKITFIVPLYWIFLVLLWFCHSITTSDEIFVTFFSGTVRSRKLNLGTHIIQWVDVSCVPESGCCCLFISSFFCLSNFHTLKFFVTLFSGSVRLRKLKLGTHLYNGWMYPGILESSCCLLVSLFLHFSFSPIFIFPQKQNDPFLVLVGVAVG